MAISKIIQSLCYTVENTKIVDNGKYKKQKDEADKWYDLLEKYIKEDKKLFNIFFNFDTERGLCDSIANEIYYREGFLCGARLALEICGFQSEEN